METKPNRSASSKMISLSKSITPFKSTAVPIKGSTAGESGSGNKRKTAHVNIGDLILVEVHTGTVNQVLSDLSKGGTTVTRKCLIDEYENVLSLESYIQPGRTYSLVDRQVKGYTSTATATSDSKGKNSASKSQHLMKEQSQTLKEILQELKALKAKVSKLEESQKDSYQLLKELTKVQTEAKHFEVARTQYVNQLQSSVANTFLSSLNRDVDDDTLQLYTIHIHNIKKIIMNILDKKDAKDPYKVQVTLKWCRNKMTTYRVDERRKVLGITPYKLFSSKKTDVLARDVIRSMKAPLNRQLETTYVKHLTLLRKFIRENEKAAWQEGHLYNNFRKWVTDKYRGEPSSAEWDTILQEDRDDSPNNSPCTSSPGSFDSQSTTLGSQELM